MGACQPHLPADPLRRFARSQDRDNKGHQPHANRAEIPKQSALYKAFHEGLRKGYVTIWMGDRLACAFGYHPGELWPEWWEITG